MKRKTEKPKPRPLTAERYEQFREAISDYQVPRNPTDKFEQERREACET